MRGTFSKVTRKFQATIPKEVRKVLGIKAGDTVFFEITPDKKVLLRKAHPLDLEFIRALEETLESEWLSEYDEEAYHDL